LNNFFKEDIDHNKKMINEELKIAILDYKEKEVIQKGKVKYFITPIKPNCAIKAKENFEKKTPEQ